MQEDIDSVKEKLWYVTNYLIDTVYYQKKVKEIQERMLEELNESQRIKNELEEYVSKIKHLSTELSKNTSYDIVVNASDRIIEFANKLVSDAEQVIEKRQKERIERMNQEMQEERIKQLKSIELYLEAIPLPLIEKSFEIEKTNSSYNALVRYTCSNSVSYSFSLLVDKSRLFSGHATISDIAGSLRIPIAIQKSWMSKKGRARYERVSQYVLQRAEITERHAYAMFRNDENSSSLIIAAPIPFNENQISVQYSIAENVINVSSEPELSSLLEKSKLLKLVERIMGELSSLEQHRGSLKDLFLNETDLIKETNVEEFVRNVTKNYTEAFRKIVSEAKDGKILTRKGEIELEKVRERVKMLGSYSYLFSYLL